MSAPICPVKECGHRLVETTGPWRDRGDWMCHGEHDGKRIWYSLELIQILESKLASAEAEWNRKEAVLVAAAQEIERKLSAAKAKLADALADAASWQKQADDRLNDAVEFGRRAEKAEARVKELEAKLTASEALAMTLLNEKSDLNLDECISELEKAAKELENDKEFQEELANDIKVAKDLEELEVLRKRIKELEGLEVNYLGETSSMGVHFKVFIPDERADGFGEDGDDEPTTLGEAMPRKDKTNLSTNQN